MPIQPDRFEQDYTAPAPKPVIAPGSIRLGKDTNERLITDFNQLSKEDQEWFNQAGAYQGMTGAEYLAYRKGIYSGTTYYGDTPSWRKLPLGMASNLANYIKFTTEAWSKDPSQIEDPELRRAVAEGVMTVAEAAAYYWSPNGSQRFDLEGYLNNQNKEAGGGNGSGSFSGVGQYGAYGNQTTGAFKNLTPEKQAERISAWNVLKSEFDRYGLGELVDSLKQIIIDGSNDAEMLLRLRQTNAYQNRFAANDVRVKNGYRALSEAEYVGLEDAYANLMRKYGLPDWYTQQGKYGKQANLENFIANDVSPAELEDRIQLGVQRIQQGPKEVLDTLRNFYPGITNGDVLAYVLDPKKALPVLQRQVQTAEIGAEATRYGLNADKTQSDLLAGLGVNQQQARSGYQAIGSGLERGRALSNIYQEPQYDQRTAEQEIFGMNNANEANRRRRKLAGLEQASFGGSSGVRGGALDANRSGSI